MIAGSEPSPAAGAPPAGTRPALRPGNVAVKRGIRIAAGSLAALVAALAAYCAVRAGLYPVSDLEHGAPHRTALMRQREAEARAKGRLFSVDQRWVSYNRVSPLLRRSILIAEDDAFYEHGGLDWDEMRAAARANLRRRRVVRGGSTITQQLAKNLFLGDRRTLTRKLTEAFLAMRLERTLSKRRIFELYLNLIEWGEGIFGAEAAARRYFGVAAAELSERQAALLAAVIINPRRYSALAPGRRIERRVRLIAGRMRKRGYLDEAAYLNAIGAAAPAPSPADTAGANGGGAPGAPPSPAPAGGPREDGEPDSAGGAPRP